MARLHCAMRFDASFADCMYAVSTALVPAPRATAQQNLESLWGGGMACLSVRSGLDVLFTALAWPRGSKILVSAITIPDVPRIIRAHGLVPVAIDVDIETLAPRLDLMEAAIDEDTKGILVAHIYGTRFSMDKYIALGKDKGLLVIEDAAEAFSGLEYKGHIDSDISMFSFGPIKFSTAWQGALVSCKNHDLLKKMREIQSRFPIQSRRSYLFRALKYAILWIGLKPFFYWLITRIVRLFGKDHHTALVPLLRSFSGPESEYFKRLRVQPSAALMQVLARRLSTFDQSRFAKNAHNGNMMAKLLPLTVLIPGYKSAIHNYWLFPIIVHDKKNVVEKLQRAGVDASLGTTQLAVVKPQGDEQLTLTPIASFLMENICYLPITDKAPQWLLHRAAKVITEATRGTRPPSL